MIILIIVCIVQFIFSAVLVDQCTNEVTNIFCGEFTTLTYTALGVTLGIGVLGFVFAVILFKIFKDGEAEEGLK